MPNRLTRRSQSSAPRSFPISGFLLMVFLLTGISGIAEAKDAKNLDSKLQLSGEQMRSVFAPATKDAHISTVEVWCRGKQVALGTVIDDDGHILSKASELQSEVHCHFADGQEVRAKLLAIDRKYDLALLHVDRDELAPAVWADRDMTDVGRWVITPGIDETPVAVGVSSVKRINILPLSGPGILGVDIDENETRPTIRSISDPFGAAARSGLQAKDVILQMSDRVVESTDSWERSMTRYHPGDTFFLRVLRGSDYLNFQVTLGSKRVKAFQRQALQNSMGIKLSSRRAGFNNVLQHDSALAANQCGGPLVNLKGEIVGINIARGGRTESYAIPVSALRTRIAELKSGRLAILLPNHRLSGTELVSQKVEETETEYPPPPPLARD